MASAAGYSVNARFLDANEEPNQRLLPIRGYEKQPLLSLEEAVQPLNEELNDLDIMVDTAMENSRKPADDLTVNESAAIHLYTMQWEEPNVSLYTKLNSILRSERRESLKIWFRYLKLVLTALFKLPSVRSTVWRGVRGNVSDQYDEDHVWWGFSSCTETVEIMEQFVGKSGVRTLFNIECLNGKAIRAHSFYKKENEILLTPGTYFRVVSKWRPSKDLYIIHLREAPAPRVYLEPPFKTSSSTTETPALQNLNISKHKHLSSASAKSNYPTATARWAQNGVTVAGGRGEGNATNQLNVPDGLHVDEKDTVIVADTWNHRILEWKRGATSGRVLAGGNGQGNRTDQLNDPTDVLVDPATDSLIICDQGNRRVTRWSRRSGTRSGEMIIDNIACSRLAMDDEGSLYVTDMGKHEVRRYRKGETSGIVVAGGNGKGKNLHQLNFPTYVCVDGDHAVYVSDTGNHRVMKWVKGDKEGIVVAGGRGEGEELTQLSEPRGVRVDAAGTLYVADCVNDRVMRWCPGAERGTVVVGGNGEGNGANQFDGPADVSFDRQGNLYVADNRNNRVQRFSIEKN